MRRELANATAASDAGLARAEKCVDAVRAAVGGALKIDAAPSLRVRFELDAARSSLASSPTSRFVRARPPTPRRGQPADAAALDALRGERDAARADATRATLARDAATATATAALKIVQYYVAGKRSRSPALARSSSRAQRPAAAGPPPRASSVFSLPTGAILIKPDNLQKRTEPRLPSLARPADPPADPAPKRPSAKRPAKARPGKKAKPKKLLAIAV